MKISLFEVEGSPGEIAAVPGLREAVLALAKRGGSEVAPEDSYRLPQTAEGPASGLSGAFREFIVDRAGNSDRAEITLRWVEEVLGWGTTEVVPGNSRKSPDGLNNYLLMYWKGPRHFGAFAYVYPGTRRVLLRLLAHRAEGHQHVTLRNVKEGTGYEVAIHLNSEDAYREAIKLAKVALSGVQRK